jgi:hypothetical protein
VPPVVCADALAVAIAMALAANSGIVSHAITVVRITSPGVWKPAECWLLQRAVKYGASEASIHFARLQQASLTLRETGVIWS